MNLCFVLVACSAVTMVTSGKVKLVDPPFSFNARSNGRRMDQNEMLVTRVDPQPPSGPPYLVENLFGKCFSNIINNYKYELCPFANVTQREQTNQWNDFKGVLGVWKEWMAEGNNFTFMHMVEGDVCAGTLHRQAKVNITCGDRSKIVSVKEPSMCRYVVDFITPYACPTDVFYVYPMLSVDGKKTWQQLEQLLLDGQLTEDDYRRKHNNLLVSENLKVGDMKTVKNHVQTVKDDKTNVKEINTVLADDSTTQKPSSTVENCSSEKVEIRRLKQLIEKLTLNQTRRVVKSPTKIHFDGSVDSRKGDTGILK